MPFAQLKDLKTDKAASQVTDMFRELFAHKNRHNRLLWSGTYAAPITVPHINEYFQLAIKLNGSPTWITAYRDGANVRGWGASATGAGYQTANVYTGTLSGDVLTTVFSGYEGHAPSGSHSAATSLAVVEIRGMY